MVENFFGVLTEQGQAWTWVAGLGLGLGLALRSSTSKNFPDSGIRSIPFHGARETIIGELEFKS